MRELESSPDTWRLKNDAEDALLTVIDLAAAVHDVRNGNGKEGASTLRKRKRRVIYKLEKISRSINEGLDAVRRFERLAVTFDERLEMKSRVDDLFFAMRTALVEMEGRLRSRLGDGNGTRH